jgi:hypothetical protein
MGPSEYLDGTPSQGCFSLPHLTSAEHDGWQYADSALPRDFAAKLSGLPIVFHHDRDDETVPFVAPLP